MTTDDPPFFFIQYGPAPEQFRGFYLIDFLQKVLPYTLSFQESDGNIYITAPQTGKTTAHVIPSEKFYTGEYGTLDQMVNALRAELTAIDNWYNTAFAAEGVYSFPEDEILT